MRVSDRVHRALTGGDGRRTRLHDQRGRLLPRRDWGDVPRAILARARRHDPDGPWMTPRAVARLAAVLSPEWRLLELGSGGSTIWYAERVAHVTTIEPEPAWARKVQARVRSSALTNVTVLSGSVRETLAALPDAQPFDVVIVDSSDTSEGTRVDHVEQLLSRSLVRALIVVDDSDRMKYAALDRLLAGWAVEHCAGMKHFPLSVTRTSLYWNPDVSSRPNP